VHAIKKDGCNLIHNLKVSLVFMVESRIIIIPVNQILGRVCMRGWIRCAKIFSIVLIVSIMTQFFFPAFSVAASDDELSDLRKSIKTIDDINDSVYSRLERIVINKFSDMKKTDWYTSVITKLVGLSSLDGTLQNTMDPMGTVTHAMFIKMLIRAMYGENALDGIEPDFDHWAARDIKKAEMEGLIGTSLYGPNNVAKPITRGEMARIIIRAYNKFEDNPLTLEECEPIKSKIKDYDSIPSLYKPFVLLAYGSGIISGYSDGRFGSNDNATRAQAAAYIIRYLDPSERAKTIVNEEKETPKREPRVLRYDDPHRPMAQEGDIFVKPDGTEVVLKVGPAGVLGELQGVATELGRIDLGGTPLKHGDLGTEGEFMGQPYVVDEKTGEGHYRSEWIQISQYYLKRAIEELGHPEEGTTYGPWLRYSRGSWVWTGPIQ